MDIFDLQRDEIKELIQICEEIEQADQFAHCFIGDDLHDLSENQKIQLQRQAGGSQKRTERMSSPGKLSLDEVPSAISDISEDDSTSARMSTGPPRDAVSEQQNVSASSSKVTSKIRLFNVGRVCDENSEHLPSTSNGERSRNETETPPKTSNLKKDILNILPKAHVDENVGKIGEDITAELATSWQHLLSNGLYMPEKKLLEAKHPIPKNCTMINAPEINPLLRNELPESVLKKDVEIQNKQKQIAMSITCISKALTKLIDGDGDRDIIRILVDAGKLLCDFQYNESVSRRNAVVIKFNKDLKNQLLENKVDTLLFGEKWKTSLLKQFEEVALKKQMDLQMQSMLLNQSYPHVDLD